MASLGAASSGAVTRDVTELTAVVALGGGVLVLLALLGAVASNVASLVAVEARTGITGGLAVTSQVAALRLGDERWG